MPLQQSFLVDSLITQVQISALSPNSQSQFQSPQVLLLMNNELKLNISSLIKSVSEEYFVTSKQYTVTPGQSYLIPTRCMGGAMRQIVLTNQQGQWIDITKMALEDITVSNYMFYSLPIWTFGYYLMNDQVNLYPQQGLNYTQYNLQINYERQPNDLILSTSCGLITAINTGTSQVTVNYIDPSWTINTTFDIISPQPQFSSVQDDQTVTNINGFVLTFSSIPSGLAVGQYVCPAGQSCIPQIPYALFPLLVQRTVLKMAEGLGDAQQIQTARNSYEEMKENALKMITPRVGNELNIIVNKNKIFSSYPYNSWVR